MTAKEAARLAWMARVNAKIATTPKAKSTLLDIADKYDAIASSDCDAPQPIEEPYNS